MKSRILKEDVQAYVKDALKRLESGAGAAASGKGDGAALGLLPWPKVDFSKFGETEVQPLSRIKKISGHDYGRVMGVNTATFAKSSAEWLACFSAHACHIGTDCFISCFYFLLNECRYFERFLYAICDL